jgi:hypothetical protein
MEFGEMLDTAASMLSEVEKQTWHLQNLLYDEYDRVEFDSKHPSEIVVLTVRSQVGPLIKELGKVTAVLNALLMEMESNDDDASVS